MIWTGKSTLTRRELRKPDLFIDLTQNDCWPELQAQITCGPRNSNGGLNFAEPMPEHVTGC